eukprot:15447595-Alexandrium_andersonii.AAC.1
MSTAPTEAESLTAKALVENCAFEGLASAYAATSAVELGALQQMQVYGFASPTQATAYLPADQRVWPLTHE